MDLVDFHPDPNIALVDGPPALGLEELPMFLEDVPICREAYEKRRRPALGYPPRESLGVPERAVPARSRGGRRPPRTGWRAETSRWPPR